MFSDHDGLKLEADTRKIARKPLMFENQATHS